MNADLRTLIKERLTGEGLLQKNWSGVLLAACDGQAALEKRLLGESIADAAATEQPSRLRVGAYLASLSVQGFRGIGSKQTLTVTPGPGLTVIVGRNGSGKSSFAEAMEVLFTGDSKRWSDRSKIWKEGWRNLHQPHPATIEAEVVLEGFGRTAIVRHWGDGGAFEGHSSYVHPKGKQKTTLAALGWPSALVSYRPFLSYNELSSMLDEGPSKLYDALSLVLGLEDLVGAQAALAQSRLERQRAVDAADDVRKELIARIEELLKHESDSRASACLDALSSKSWGVAEISAILEAGTVVKPDHDTAVLTRAAALESPDEVRVRAIVMSLREAEAKRREMAGSEANRSRELADLLESALGFHIQHGDADCPVCHSSAALNPAWADATRQQITQLRANAVASEEARRSADAARRSARELLTAPPSLLAQLFDVGLDGLDVLRERWTVWHAGHSIPDLAELADHIESHQASLAEALEAVRASARAEVKRREDRWRPIADALSEWTGLAVRAKNVAEDVARIKFAETWLKDASADIRNERFAPIADRAMATWQHLRQHSNVELGRIELTGTRSQRRVSLDVTVDGVPGAALGVMSQGELHALALSLFLPRATLAESPFRFVVIDDPVQSMDSARVDGLAKALEETARTRQVIVFTHDDRLADAVRRLQIPSTILNVTRRPKSSVEVRPVADPVKANLDDARVLLRTPDLPEAVVKRTVPGFCRAALEASFIDLFRRRRLLGGQTHEDVETELSDAGKLTTLAALALFDDQDKGGDVMKRLNQFGSWAGDVFKQCNQGAHEPLAVDLTLLIKDTERLTVKILELK